MTIITLLPPEDGDFTPLEEALAEAAARSSDSQTEIVVDDEMNNRVVQLIGDSASLEMPCRSNLQYLVLQLKNLERYCCFEVTFKDVNGVKRYLICNSKQSTARITKSSCSMPLELTEGWNYLCLDLHQLADAAFGVKYGYCTKVAVYSSTRLWRCYFQDRKYADIELPPHLRTSPPI